MTNRFSSYFFVFFQMLSCSLNGVGYDGKIIFNSDYVQAMIQLRYYTLAYHSGVPGSITVNVRFMKWHLDKYFSEVLWFYLSLSIISPQLHNRYCLLRCATALIRQRMFTSFVFMLGDFLSDRALARLQSNVFLWRWRWVGQKRPRKTTEHLSREAVSRLRYIQCRSLNCYNYTILPGEMYCVVVKRLAFLARIPKLLSSNIGMETGDGTYNRPIPQLVKHS
jgi:hypothetical protein